MRKSFADKVRLGYFRPKLTSILYKQAFELVFII